MVQLEKVWKRKGGPGCPRRDPTCWWRRMLPLSYAMQWQMDVRENVGEGGQTEGDGGGDRQRVLREKMKWRGRGRRHLQGEPGRRP